MVLYYAGYDHIDTEIAVFNTEEEADDWVENAVDFDRRRYTKEDVEILVGKKPKEEIDCFGVLWYT